MKLSGPDDFDTSILSTNMKTPFSEICRGLFWGIEYLATGEMYFQNGE